MYHNTLVPLVYLPAPATARLRGICKDLELPWLHLRRHVAAQSLERILSDIGLDVHLASWLEPRDTPLVWECIADEVFVRSCGRCVHDGCRDPFRPRRYLPLKRRPHLAHLVG